MKIYLIRHGETDWNKDLKIQGRINNPLNKTGVSQAKKIQLFINNIKFDKVYSSSLQRAIDTALIATSNSYDNYLINDNFIERNFGALEGENTKSYYSITDFKKIKGYELDETLLQRVENGFNQLNLENTKNETIAIFSHSHVLKSALILFNSDEYNFATKIPNCGILEIIFDNNKITNIKLMDPISNNA